MSAILGATRWPSNADLMLDVAKLGYIKNTDLVLDATYGKGTFWKYLAGSGLWDDSDRGGLIANDRDVPGAVYQYDFRGFPVDWENRFDVVVFDPPYVAIGGRTTTGIAAMHAAYGMTDAPRTPAGVQQQINDGMDECTRVLKPKGYLLVKCQNYISSGKFFSGEHRTWAHAVHQLGLRQADEFVMYGSPRPQPKNRTRKHKTCKGRGCDDCAEGRVSSEQQHAQRNDSTLFVFRKPRGKK